MYVVAWTGTNSDGEEYDNEILAEKNTVLQWPTLRAVRAMDVDGTQAYLDREYNYGTYTVCLVRHYQLVEV